jgi:hypothetical protein
MTPEEALRAIARIITDPMPRATRKVDSVFKVLVHAGVFRRGDEGSRVRSETCEKARASGDVP